MAAAPTAQQTELLPRLETKGGAAVDAVNAIVSTDVPAFNRLLLESGRGLVEGGGAIP
jgi:hypothetical protein